MKDFAWWSGLPLRDVRPALAAVAGQLEQVQQHEVTWWLPRGTPAALERTALALPGFDEYLLGYQSREVVLDPRYVERICPGGNGVFAPTLVSRGRVVGTWRRAERTLMPFTTFTPSERRSLATAVARYSKFTSTARQ